MKSIFLVSVIYLLFILSFTKAATDSSEAYKIIKDYQDIPRYTYFTTDRKLTKYPDGFCGGESAEDCDWGKYAEAIVLLSGVTLIIALVTLILGVLFWLGRTCLFGGCHPTHGCLCPGPKYDPDIGEGYTTRSVWILKIAVFFLAIGCVPLFIVSLTGNKQTTSNISDLSSTILDKADDILDQMSNFSTSLQDPKYQMFESVTDQIVTDLNNMISEGDDFRSHGQDVSDAVKKYNGYRNDLVYAGFVVGIVAVGLIALSALCNLPSITRIGALSLILLIPFSWIVFSAHYPVNSFLADVCLSYNQTGTNQFSNFSDNPLISEVISGCQANYSAIIPVFDDVVSLVNSLETQGYNVTCTAVKQICALQYPRYEGGIYTAPPVETYVADCPTGIECSEDTLPQFLNSTLTDLYFGCYTDPATYYCNLSTPPTDCATPSYIITCDYVTRSNVSDCAENCQNTNFKNISSTIDTGYTTLGSLVDLWDNEIKPFITCTNVMPFFNDVENIICVKTVNSLTLLIIPSAIFAIFLTILGILAVLGTKRFNANARRKGHVTRGV